MMSSETKLCWFMDSWLKELDEFVILLGYRGSIAHNTYQKEVTSDDVDVMGVFIPPPDCIFGIESVETINRQIVEKGRSGEIVWDIVYYSLPKFMKLVLKQNPNVLGFLWLKDEHYLKKEWGGERLIAWRKSLLSKRCYDSFRGYATGQLKRMRNSVTGKLGAKRKKLVEKFGYDVKNASHLIRLLRQGVETLLTGEVKVFRDEDRDMLLSIKRGEWTFEQVEEEANRLFQALDEAYVKSPLPEKVDRTVVNRLCKMIIQDFYRVGR